jgi:hypothetical protein
MPLFGRLEAAPLAERLPLMKNLDTEPWTLPRAEILQLAFEVNDETLSLLPRAMHPSVPLYATWLVSSYPESPIGPFNVAQLRLMGRAGAHPRGYVLGAIATTPDAVAALRARWGFPAQLGAVTLRRYHDQIAAVATVDGESVLEAALVNPEPISASDIQYIHTVTLARVADGNGSVLQLVQVDPHYTFHKAERGRPRLSRFDGAWWGAAGLRPLHPISASVATCDTDLPQIRFAMDANLPVTQATRRIR